MRIRLLAVWWIACLLWSSTFLFIRVGIGEVRPFTLAWTRLAIALAILAPIALVRGDLRTLRAAADLRRVASAGLLLLGVNYALLFWGAQFIPSGLVAILQSGTPLLALAFACAIGQERLTFRKLITLILGIVGVALIFGSEALTSGRMAMTGAAAVFAAAACVAGAYVWMKSYGGRIAPLAMTTIQSGAAVIPLLCLALFTEGIPSPAHWSASAWGAVLYLAVAASVVAAAVIIGVALVARGGGSSSSGGNPNAEVVTSRLSHDPIDFVSAGTWPVNYTNLAGAMSALGLTPTQEAASVNHYHVHIQLDVDGHEVPVPAQIGLDSATVDKLRSTYTEAS